MAAWPDTTPIPFKFADDSTIVARIMGDDKSVFRKKIENLIERARMSILL